MLFVAMYHTRAGSSEETERRSLQLFANWQPPQGFAFRAHYSRADGRGGIAIVETDSAAAMLEATAPFATFFDFETVPVLDITEAVGILGRVDEWRVGVR